MKFKDMPYERLNIDETINKIKYFINEIETANSANEQIKTIKDYAEFKKNFSTTVDIASVRHSIDTNDEFYKKEKDFYDENLPLIETLFPEYAKAVLNSKFKNELIEEFGEHYFKLLECNLTLNEKAIPFLQKENKLSTKYGALVANSKIELRGKTYTLTQMAPFLQDTNRELRKEAYEASNKFFEDNQEEFDTIYDELVKTRHEMAVALGYNNYVELAYKILCRTDYGPTEVAKYREKVLKTLTPLSVRIHKMQQQMLGLDEFKFYDKAVDFKDGNSKPLGDVNFIVDNAKIMYEELSKETGEFFNFMIDNDLMDLVAKHGKRSGGYCTSFDKYKSPFIFSNFNGTNGDIDVITHEAGHAFQNYLSQYQVLPEYIWPTYEACEIHSMSMEFLTWPWMELFFKEDADKFRFAALKSALTFVPYGVTIDEFQHFVYENPTATPKQRREKFHEIEMKYQPDLDYDNAFLESGTYWFKQLHVFEMPFYYIDYTLAQVCAFQYLIKYLEDKEHTLEEYITLCKAGGSKSFFDLIEVGKLKNPMTTNVLEDITPKLEKILLDLKDKVCK